MTDNLNGTIALVTSASSGIGRATAITLAKVGARVALVSRDGNELGRVADLIDDNGGETLVIEADLSTADAAQRAVTRTLASMSIMRTLRFTRTRSRARSPSSSWG